MFTHWLIKPGASQWLWALGVLGDFLIIGGVLLGLLQLIPSRFRKTFIAVITFLAGLIYAVEFFMPTKPGTDKNFLTDFTEQVGDALLVVSAFTLGLGIYNLLRFHGKNLARQRPGWINNLVFYAAFLALMLVGFWKDLAPSAVSRNTFDFLFTGTVAALGATMFSTIGFFIVSAAYRAFRIRSSEATLMLAAAFVVMLGQVPVGAYLTSGIPSAGLASNLRLENASYWVLTQPNMAAWRAIAFGIEVGALAMALRTWLSLERGGFFDREL